MTGNVFVTILYSCTFRVVVLSASMVRVVRHKIQNGTGFKRREQNQRLYDTKIRKETVSIAFV